MLEATETRPERIKRGGRRDQKGSSEKSEVWMKGGEKMDWVDFRFPSGCCQVYK